MERRMREVADERFTDVQARVAAEMARLHVPGVAVGIVDGDREYLGGQGVTNVDHPLPVDGDTLFQIGSTTKTLTALVAMRLVEDFALDLDEPVRTYLPDLRLADEDVAARVTMRHLFTHTGGWDGDFFDDTGRGEDALARMVARLDETPQIAPLGAVWSYNNAGFYIAGRVIEVVTGQPFEMAVQELVLTPLGMQHSYFFAEDAITEAVSAGHLVRDGAVQIAHPWGMARAGHPAGGLISSARDQLIYARFHLGDGTAADGTRVVTPETMKLLHTAIGPGGNAIDAMALVWRIQLAANGTRIIGHGGAMHGQMSAFLLVPERQWAITVLTNADCGDELHRAITRFALERYLGLALPDLSPITLAEDALREYEGRYTSLATAITIVAQDGVLHATLVDRGGFPKRDSPPTQPPQQAQFAPIGADRFVGTDEHFARVPVEFLRDAQGTIAWFRASGRLHVREQ
jgi:CubicO group peptidase (beta-lactamase class C family)